VQRRYPVEADQLGLEGVRGVLELDHLLGDAGTSDVERPDLDRGYASTRSLKATISSSIGSAIAWIDVQ
jgi:hypothetical protein